MIVELVARCGIESREFRIFRGRNSARKKIIGRCRPLAKKKIKSFKEAINNDLAIAALALLPNRSLSRPIHLDGDREKNENFLIAFQHF